MTHTHYEIDIHDGHRWMRLKHERHALLIEAEQTVDQIRRILKRKARIVKITTHEEIVHDQNHHDEDSGSTAR